MVREGARQLRGQLGQPPRPTGAGPLPEILLLPAGNQRLPAADQRVQDRNCTVPAADQHLPAGNQQSAHPNPAAAELRVQSAEHPGPAVPELDQQSEAATGPTVEPAEEPGIRQHHRDRQLQAADQRIRDVDKQL